MKLILLIAIVLLNGCASYQNLADIPNMNVVPQLTDAQLAEKVAGCKAKKLIPEPYPPTKPQIVLCKVPSVLPPGYVSPVPYVRIL